MEYEEITFRHMCNAAYAVNEGCWHPFTHKGVWNPATDQNKALELAEILGICMNFDEKYAYKRMPNLDLFQEFWGEGHWRNWMEAVVAVAAGIGGRRFPHLYWSRYEQV